MKGTSLLLLVFMLFSSQNELLAQPEKSIISGPMLTQVELRTARIWVEVSKGAWNVSVKYWKKSAPGISLTKAFPEPSKYDFRPVQVEIGGLDFNTTYDYVILINGNSTNARGEFTTKDLWQYRKPAPDFSFLTGSCSYTNEPEYGRPSPTGPYGKDSSIFETMASTSASFMLWLGDNWYTREVDFFSEWGLWYRASHDRRSPVMRKLWKAFLHYAIWDDHDYGPNDADKSYVLKDASRNVFMNYWGNPSYGEKNQGTYSKMSFADADFFLLDARYFRSADEMESELDNKPNPGKRMWGEMQLEWLKNALLNSTAAFKFIVTGSQVLNKVSPYDCLRHYPIEFNGFLDFLEEEKINGVVFLTGDRHHSEVIKYERKGTYTLYDITSSPLTSGVSLVGGVEKDNPDRMPGTLIEAQNFTKISITGAGDQRILKATFLGLKGENLGEWTVQLKDLRSPLKK